MKPISVLCPLSLAILGACGGDAMSGATTNQTDAAAVLNLYASWFSVSSDENDPQTGQPIYRRRICDVDMMENGQPVDSNGRLVKLVEEIEFGAGPDGSDGEGLHVVTLRTGASSQEVIESFWEIRTAAKTKYRKICAGNNRVQVDMGDVLGLLGTRPARLVGDEFLADEPADGWRLYDATEQNTTDTPSLVHSIHFGGPCHLSKTGYFCEGRTQLLDLLGRGKTISPLGVETEPAGQQE